MSNDHEIWQSAQEMIDRYGERALTEINKRITELEELGETDAHAVWVQIGKVTAALIESQNQSRKQ